MRQKRHRHAQSARTSVGRTPLVLAAMGAVALAITMTQCSNEPGRTSAVSRSGDAPDRAAPREPSARAPQPASADDSAQAQTPATGASTSSPDSAPAPTPETPVVAGSLPVTVTVDRPGFVTAVIEDADGRRVCNLASEVRAAAGQLKLRWDLYDVGVKKSKDEPYARAVVKPGTYTVRGLMHDGIVMRYEQSVYSPGTPPWKTKDSTGTWMGDHAAPADVLYLDKGPNGKPSLILATGCAEAGHALSYTDLEGRKYKGVNSDNFNGATAVTIDLAPGADRDKVYFLNGNGFCTLGENDRHVVIYKPKPMKKPPVLDEYGFGDLAVYDGIAVIPNSDNRNNIDTTTGNLLVVDIAGKAELCNQVTGVSRGVAFGTDGKLYALIDDALVRFRWDAARKKLVEEAKVVKGLVQPHRMTIGRTGNFYISVLGDLHQVWVFNKSGRKLRTIGKPGGGQIGTYDEKRMHRPFGMSVTPRGELWIAENSTIPKRISIWNAKTGAFKRAIYGGPQYGGGGTLDPTDKTIFYYPHLVSPTDRGLMVFELDWKTGGYRLTDIPMRTPLCGRRLAQKWGGADESAPQEPERIYMPYDPIFNNRRGPTPHYAVHTAGHRYLFNRAYRADTPFYTVMWRWDEGTDELAVPVAIIASKGDMFRADREGIFDKSADRENIRKARDGTEAHAFVWSDRNSDQLATADEIQFYKIPGEKLQWGGVAGTYIRDDLSFAGFHLNGGMVPAPRIDGNGVPHWDLSKVTPLGTRDFSVLNHQALVPVLGSDYTLFGAMGWDYFSQPQGYDRKTGELKWTYRYYDIWLVPQFPGQCIAGVSSMGRMVKPKSGEAGEIWSTSTEKGAAYLFTADGLFLKTLGGDVRTTPLWRFPEAKRGMVVDGVSFEDECFLPTLNQGSDGEIYIVIGKEHVSIMRLDGLQTVRRKSWGTVTVTPEMIAGLPAVLEEPIQKQIRRTLAVPLGGTAPEIDGEADDWADMPPESVATIDHNTTASLKIADGRIFGIFRTGDPKLLDNSAADPRFLFKFGGALDLFFGAKWDPGCLYENNPYTEGDCRVLIAQIKGKPTAVLYRPVHPSAPKTEACVFESPIGREEFASVKEITDSMQFAEDGKGTFEFSLDLGTVLRHKHGGEKWGSVRANNLGKQDWHEDKTVILGDLGIIRGNGSQNVMRACWNSLDTWMTSDIPTEVRWRSINFGVLKLVK